MWKAEKKQGTLVDNLVKLPDGRAEIAASDNRQAKRAVLRYECLAEQKLSEEITISLMEISIESRAVSSNQGADGKCGTSSSGRFKIRRRRGKFWYPDSSLYALWHCVPAGLYFGSRLQEKSLL